MIGSLWGDLAIASETTPPVTILREQASTLSQLTNHILEGRVTLITQGEAFLYDLDVVAPALDHYVYTILQVKHSVALYPLKVIDQITQNSYDCENEDEFVKILRRILSSVEVRKVIQSLLSQSKEISSTPERIPY